MHTNRHEFGADVFSRMNTDWRGYRKFSSTRIYFFTGEHWRIPSTPFRNQLLINPFVLPRVSNQIGNQPPLCPLIRNSDSPAEGALSETLPECEASCPWLRSAVVSAGPAAALTARPSLPPRPNHSLILELGFIWLLDLASLELPRGPPSPHMLLIPKKAKYPEFSHLIPGRRGQPRTPSPLRELRATFDLCKLSKSTQEGTNCEASIWLVPIPDHASWINQRS